MQQQLHTHTHLMPKLQLSQPAEYLRASHIKRWGIVQTHMPQSIGEHMYRVWILSHKWGPLLGFNEQEMQLIERWALTHDLPEIRTGDAPTPHKTPELKAHLASIEHQICPELEVLEKALKDTPAADFCKFCDTAESILFLGVNGAGAHARDVNSLLEAQMHKRLSESRLSRPQQKLLSGLFNDAKAQTC